MEFSDIDYTGWKNGKCYVLVTKYSGPGADKKNAKTVADIVGKGYELREMPARDACAAMRAGL